MYIWQLAKNMSLRISNNGVVIECIFVIDGRELLNTYTRNLLYSDYIMACCCSIMYVPNATISSTLYSSLLQLMDWCNSRTLLCYFYILPYWCCMKYDSKVGKLWPSWCQVKWITPRVWTQWCDKNAVLRLYSVNRHCPIEKKCLALQIFQISRQNQYYCVQHQV